MLKSITYFYCKKKQKTKNKKKNKKPVSKTEVSFLLREWEEERSPQRSAAPLQRSCSGGLQLCPCWHQGQATFWAQMEDTPLLIIWPQACRLNSLRLGALSVKVVSTHVTGFVRIKQTTLKDYNTCQVRSQHSEVSAGLLMTSLGHWVHSPSQATRTRQGTGRCVEFKTEILRVPL